jgi:hypothetical protein
MLRNICRSDLSIGVFELFLPMMCRILPDAVITLRGRLAGCAHHGDSVRIEKLAIRLLSGQIVVRLLLTERLDLESPCDCGLPTWRSFVS